MNDATETIVRQGELIVNLNTRVTELTAAIATQSKIINDLTNSVTKSFNHAVTGQKSYHNILTEESTIINESCDDVDTCRTTDVMAWSEVNRILR